MKIKMILTNAFSPDVRVYKEAKYLVSQGHEVEVLCWDKTPEKGLPRVEKQDGIRIRRFGISAIEGTGYKQIVAYLSFIHQCRKYLKRRKCDVLHCHDLDGAIVGYLARKRFVFDMHEFYDKGGKVRKKLSHIIGCFLAKRSVGNIYVSSLNLEAYGKGIEDRFFPLRNYCDSSMFRGCNKIPSDVLRIAYIGRVRNQIKEFAALFKAVKDLERVRVDIYGDGPDLEQLRVMAEKNENVTIHGAFNGLEDSVDIFRNTDVSYVAYDPTNPNYQGEFEPVKLFEAMFTGTPIIATQSLNPGRFAVDKGVGLAVDTRSDEELKEAICYLRDNPKAMKGFESRMKEISKEYDWNNVVQILDKVYETVKNTR
ncbi:MAG: glycosyltransferase family 4 protein [Lachnospiraceae bacterium]|nr:glycosyltransferase family 4 protein [Lachnospiraceae bacterium]